MLRSLLAQAAPRDLDVGLALQRIALALFDGEIGCGNAVDVCVVHVVMKAHRRVFASRVVEHALWREGEAGHARVYLERLPGLESGGNLIGEDLRIAGGVEDLLRQHAGYLMMPVSICHAANKNRANHHGPVETHGAHRVVEHTLVTPLRERLLHRLREAVVGDAAPVLLIDTVVFIGAQQLIGPDQSQGVVVGGGHGVLAALAARQREQRCTHAKPTAFVGQHAAVFIVRVGDDHHQAGRGIQPLQALVESRRAAILRQRHGLDSRSRGGEQIGRLGGAGRGGSLRADRGRQQSSQ